MKEKPDNCQASLFLLHSRSLTACFRRARFRCTSLRVDTFPQSLPSASGLFSLPPESLQLFYVTSRGSPRQPYSAYAHRKGNICPPYRFSARLPAPGYLRRFRSSIRCPRSPNTPLFLFPRQSKVRFRISLHQLQHTVRQCISCGTRNPPQVWSRSQ